MTRLPWNFTSLVALLTLACADNSTGLPGSDPAISPARQWSGGEVTLTGELFSEGPGVFSITAENQSLAWRRTNDSTIIVQLPKIPSGDLQLGYESKRGNRQLGVVEVAGFDTVRMADVPLGGEFNVWPDQNGGRIIGLAAPAGMIIVAILDPATGHVTTYPNLTVSEFYSPGFSYQTGVILVQGSMPGTTDVWQMFPTPALLYSYSVPFSRHVFELDLDTLLVTAHHQTYTYASPPGGTPWTQAYIINFESPYHLHFSPRGDRAAMQGSARFQGILVYDMATGDTAFSIPAITTLGATVFSSDGSQFTMAGQAVYGDDSTVVLTADATTGTVLKQTTIPYVALGLNRDPLTNRLLIPSIAGDGFHLLVLDGSTLAQEADLMVPASEGVCANSICGDAAVVIARAGSPKAYVVPSNQNTPILSFDMRD